MTYREEFPDFDPATLPAIPPTWSDVSWHNDACPSFDTGHTMTVFIDYTDPQAREWDYGARFLVLSTADETLDHVLLETDDWGAVLAFVANQPKGLDL